MGRRRAGTSLVLVWLAGCGAAAFEEAGEESSVIRELTQSRIREVTVGAAPSEGDALQCAAMQWPVAGQLSSPFGVRDGRMHDGIDLAVGEDTPVLAACDGVVAYAGDRLRGYGNLVIVRHTGGLSTLYAHNHRLLVREGEPIARGQAIALSGQTGRASAPHLHFEVRKDSIARDPLGYLQRP
jgi:murein DD-endopeptidase MepM/ murein hydrolase activator NlpD